MESAHHHGCIAVEDVKCVHDHSWGTGEQSLEEYNANNSVRWVPELLEREGCSHLLRRITPIHEPRSKFCSVEAANLLVMVESAFKCHQVTREAGKGSFGFVSPFHSGRNAHVAILGVKLCMTVVRNELNRKRIICIVFQLPKKAKIYSW